MKPTLFKGSGVALATPFTATGIDWERFKEQIDFQIDRGTQALIVLGTTGEPSTMPQDERDLAVELALSVAEGRVPVIVGTGSNSTQTCVRLSKRAEELGADGLLIVTPYYNRPNQRGMIQHYLTVADAVETPIVMYNVPSRTGSNLTPETVAKLSEHENIVALKEAGGNLVQLNEAIGMTGDNLTIYSGNDDQVLEIMALGGQGVISVAANIIPAQMQEMAQSFLDGDIATSRRLQTEWLPLMKLLFVEPNPQPLKAAMKMLGMDRGVLRLPLAEVTEKSSQAIRAELVRMGLLDT